MKRQAAMERAKLREEQKQLAERPQPDSGDKSSSSDQARGKIAKTKYEV
jgi:tRNA (adenine57-N1/adenine58-N1)-methyltransferase